MITREQRSSDSFLTLHSSDTLLLLPTRLPGSMACSQSIDPLFKRTKGRHYCFTSALMEAPSAAPAARRQISAAYSYGALQTINRPPFIHSFIVRFVAFLSVFARFYEFSVRFCAFRSLLTCTAPRLIGECYIAT